MLLLFTTGAVYKPKHYINERAGAVAFSHSEKKVRLWYFAALIVTALMSAQGCIAVVAKSRSDLGQ